MYLYNFKLLLPNDTLVDLSPDPDNCLLVNHCRYCVIFLQNK